MKSLTALPLLAAVLAPGAPAAQNIDARTEQVIAALLQNNGYRAELDYLSDGEPVIRSADGGSSFSIYFYDCDGGTRCRTIQFFSAYDLPQGMSLDRVNEWNRDYRFGKAYLDEEMDPFIEMDVNLDFGVSPENLLDTLDWWTVVMHGFEDFIGW